MDCRHSPIAKTPPRYLPHIPGVTTPGIAEDTKAEANNAAQSGGINREGKSSTGEIRQLEPLGAKLGLRTFFSFINIKF